MKVSKIFHKIHLYLALVFFLPLALQGLSGAILVIEKNFEPKYKINSVSNKIFSAEEIFEIALKEAPEGFRANIIKMPLDNNEAAIVGFVNKQSHQNLKVVINPEDLQLIAKYNDNHPFLEIVKKLHTNFLMEKIGRTIVGVIGIIMLIIAISGIVLWFKKFRNFSQIFTLNFKSKGYRFHFDLHYFLASWGLIILLFSSFSGVYLAFPKEVGGGIAKVFGGENFANVKVSEDSKKDLKINDAILLAKNSIKQDAKLSAINLPLRQGQPYRISFIKKDEEGAYNKNSPAITAFINPDKSANPQIIEIRNPYSSSLAHKTLLWLRPLHEGRGLGTIWNVLTILGGFLPLIFVITGTSMWWLKKQNKDRLKKQVLH